MSIVLCLVTQSCLTLCDPMDCSLPGSSVHGDSLAKNTEVGCHALLQGIFPIQESNWGLLYCGQILYQLSQQGIGIVLIALTFCGRISTRVIKLVSYTIWLFVLSQLGLPREWALSFGGEAQRKGRAILG